VRVGGWLEAERGGRRSAAWTRRVAAVIVRLLFAAKCQHSRAAATLSLPVMIPPTDTRTHLFVRRHQHWALIVDWLLRGFWTTPRNRSSKIGRPRRCCTLRKRCWTVRTTKRNWNKRTVMITRRPVCLPMQFLALCEIRDVGSDDRGTRPNEHRWFFFCSDS